MRRFINYRMVPVFLFALIISIATGTFLHFGYGFGLIALAAGLFITALSAKKYRKYSLRTLTVLIAVVLGLMSIWLTLGIRGVTARTVSESTEITGYVSNISSFDADGRVSLNENIYLRDAYYTDDKGKHRLDGHVLLKTGDSESTGTVYIGSKLTIKARLSALGVNAADKESLDNYKGSVNYVAVIYEMIASSGDNVSRNVFDEIKIGVKSIFNRYMPDSAGFVYAMIFGDKSAISDIDRAAFSATGMAHLLAVSGLHVSMLAAIVAWILKRLKLNGYIKLGVFTGVLILFSFLCCFSPSVLRASVMILIFYLSRIMGLKNDAISTYSFAGAAILLFRPLYLFDLSFIMSFMAVASLIFFAKPIKSRLKFLPDALSSVLSASIAVNFGLLPVMLHYFGVVSLVFLLSNLLILPIITVAYPLVVVLTAIAFVPYLGYLLVPLNFVFYAVIAMINALAALPFPRITAGFGWPIIIVSVIIFTALSRYLMINIKVKKIVALCSIAALTLTILVANDAFMRVETVQALYVNAYRDVGEVYLVTDSAGRKLMVFNAEIDAFSADGAIYSLKRERLERVDAIVKENVTVEELAVLRNRMTEFGFTYLIAAYVPEEYSSFNVKWMDHSPYQGLSIAFHKDNEIAVTTKDMSLLFSTEDALSYQGAYDYDVIFAENALADAINMAPGYIVSNNGYLKNLDYCVSKDFTFQSVNGKIKAWRKP